MTEESRTPVQCSSPDLKIESNEQLPFYRLPAELLLKVVESVPPHSRASLSLCSRPLHNSLYNYLHSQDLQLPREQPPDFQEPKMSQPKFYRPERWEFLCLLEKDLSEWRLCSTCFKLHPAIEFNPVQLKNKPEDRTCSNTSGEAHGIVDLCPCHKLTRYGKRRVEIYIFKQRCYGGGKTSLIEGGKQFLPSSGLFIDGPITINKWHSCRQIYGDITLDIAIKLWSGRYFEVSLRTFYHSKCPMGSDFQLSLLGCPHRKLSTWVCKLTACRETHPNRISCRKCYEMQKCRYCNTLLLGLKKRTRESEKMISYSFWIERSLDDRCWNSQIVFPFSPPRHQNNQLDLSCTRDTFMDNYPDPDA